MATHKINEQTAIDVATSSQYFISLFLFSKRFDYLTNQIILYERCYLWYEHLLVIEFTPRL